MNGSVVLWPRPCRGLPVLQAVHALARQLVRPGTRFASRLVRTVEVHHDVPRRRFAQNRLIPIDHLLRLVIEEVDLGADDAQRATLVEELALLADRRQRAAVLPQPDADVTLLRIVHEPAQLFVGPPLPQPFDDVVFEPQLLREPGERLDSIDGVLAAVEETPDRPTRLHPAAFALRATAPKAAFAPTRLFRKHRGIWRRREIVDDVGIDEGVQRAADDHHTPW